jgi:dynein heavy chain
MRSFLLSGRFLADIPAVADDVRENMAHHMAFVHLAVTDASGAYLETERRYNYTTPKSYLELISLYKGLLAKKREELRLQKERLENGVLKISQASAQVTHPGSRLARYPPEHCKVNLHALL